MRKRLLPFLFVFVTGSVFGQGFFSGDLMMNVNFFQKDTNIRASGNPLYENALSGSEAWLTTRYSQNGFTVFARVDAFGNSNLKVNTSTNTDFGIGAWSIEKEFDDLTIHVGSIYDQIGCGALFRAYEDRGLMLDNALMGIELKYKMGDHFFMKAMGGQMKNNNVLDNTVNKRYQPVVKAFNAEGDVSIGGAQLTPGVGVMNRTLDGITMADVAKTIESQDTSKRFSPRYNMYAFSVYNNLVYRNFSWYMEGAYKTHEAIFISNLNDPDYNLYADRAGNIVYTTFSYGQKGIAVNLTGKRTQDFAMRISPDQKVLMGMMNWQPIVAVLRPLRLMSRYTPASQNLSELAGTANVVISPNDVTNITGTFTRINTLEDKKLYREVYGEIQYHGLDNWVLEGGFQYIEYNLLLYQNRAKGPLLRALTPFAEITYRLSEKKSIRFETQYMHAEQDYGSWAFALLEYNVAPQWSFALSDMYNIVPNKGDDNLNYKNPGNHYYNIFAAYTKGPHRFTMAYVKQVDGINCTGGVCRYEPAFSGVKATLNTSF